jgi:hypothetical protein
VDLSIAEGKLTLHVRGAAATQGGVSQMSKVCGVFGRGTRTQMQESKSCVFDGATLPKLLVVFLLVGSGHAGRDAPKLVYGTYLGGRDKECATGITVGHSGDAYIVGRTPSPDFPVTPGAFSTKTSVDNNDWIGFVSRISPHGDRLVGRALILNAEPAGICEPDWASSHSPIDTARIVKVSTELLLPAVLPCSHEFLKRQHCCAGREQSLDEALVKIRVEVCAAVLHDCEAEIIVRRDE